MGCFATYLSHFAHCDWWSWFFIKAYKIKNSHLFKIFNFL